MYRSQAVWFRLAGAAATALISVTDFRANLAFGGVTWEEHALSALLPAGLAFLMLVVGLRLTADDFARLWQSPRSLVVGLVLQVGALPVLAVLISRGLNLPPNLSLGLRVVAAAPGGITSNFITLLARGDVALSTTMTLATSLAAAISIPLVLTLGGAAVPGGFAALLAGLVKTGAAVLVVSAVPLFIGLLLRRSWPDATLRWTALLDRLATAIFFAIVLAAFVQNWPAMMAHLTEAGLAAVLLNASTIALAFVTGRVLSLAPRQTLAIAIECGLQNVAMAMFVASTVLKDDALMIPALIYAVVMNVSALGLLAAGRMRNAGAVAPDGV